MQFHENTFFPIQRTHIVADMFLNYSQFIVPKITPTTAENSHQRHQQAQAQAKGEKHFSIMTDMRKAGKSFATASCST